MGERKANLRSGKASERVHLLVADITHCNVTAHPTAAWTLQQFREAIPSDHAYRFLLHDRDSIFSAEVDDLKALGLRVLRTPVQTPKANAYCERLMGTIRRECLDYVIPLSEKHLRKILREWVAHYNQGRPHAIFGRNQCSRWLALFLEVVSHSPLGILDLLPLCSAAKWQLPELLFPQ